MQILVWWKQHKAKKKKETRWVIKLNVTVKLWSPQSCLLCINNRRRKSSPLHWEILGSKASNHEINIITQSYFLMLSYPCIISLHVSHQHMYPCQYNVRCSASGNQPLSPPHHYYITLTTTGWWFFFLHTVGTCGARAMTSYSRWIFGVDSLESQHRVHTKLTKMFWFFF